jgi:hypothetical protein
MYFPYHDYGKKGNIEIKFDRKEHPLEKFNELREKEKLCMEKHRHPSVTTSTPYTMDPMMVST